MKKEYKYFVSIHYPIGKNYFFKEIFYNTDKKIEDVNDINSMKEKIAKRLSCQFVTIINFQLLSEQMVEVDVDEKHFGVL